MSSIEVIQVILNQVKEAIKEQSSRIDDLERKDHERDKKDHERELAQAEKNVQLKIMWSSTIFAITTIIGLFVWWLQTHGGKQP